MPHLAVNLIYLGLGLALAFSMDRGLASPLHRTILSVVILGVIALPVAADPTFRNICRAGMLLPVLALEGLFHARPYRFAGDENVRNAALYAFKLVASFLVGTLLASSVARWPQLPWSLSRHGAPLWLQAMVAFVLIDLYQYAFHWCEHRFELLWRFHKIRHTSEELSVLAASRFHFVEWSIRQAIAAGVLVYALGLSAEAFNYGYLLPTLLVDAFNHANLDFPRRPFWLSRWVSLPNTHALHHSRADPRANYGEVLILWDVLFGTFRAPAGRISDFGIEDRRFARRGILGQHLEALGLSRGELGAELTAPASSPTSG